MQTFALIHFNSTRLNTHLLFHLFLVRIILFGLQSFLVSVFEMKYCKAENFEIFSLILIFFPAFVKMLNIASSEVIIIFFLILSQKLLQLKIQAIST